MHYFVTEHGDYRVHEMYDYFQNDLEEHDGNAMAFIHAAFEYKAAQLEKGKRKKG